MPNKLVYAFILAALPAMLLAQEPKTHEKKHIVTENKEIFWNKDLPVYFFISTSPDGSNPVRLIKGNAEKYTNPYYFDTEGPNFVRTRWAVDPETGKAVVPALEVEFEVQRDGLAPVSSLDFSNAPKFVSKGKVFYGKGLSAKVVSRDGLSGVQSIYKSVNKEAYADANGPVKFDSEGEYLVQYYAVDKVGNTEEPGSKLFTVDLTAPVTSHKVGGIFLNDIFSPSATVALGSVEEGAGLRNIKYSFNNGSEKTYSNTLYVGWLDDGEHTIEYYATDYVKNTEEKKSLSFYLDKTPPTVRADIEGARYKAGGKTFIAGATRIQLSAIDNKAGVEDIYYSIAGGEYQKYEKPFPLNLKQGAAAVKFYATDKVENKSKANSSAETGNLYLDLTAPKVSHAYQGKQFFNRDTMFITSATDVILKATDYESGVEKITWSLNGGDETTYDGGFKIDSEGVHQIDYFAYDNVGNRRKESFFFVVDNEGPEIYHHLSMDAIGSQKLKDRSEALPVYAAHTLLYLAATDELVGTEKIYYSLDSGPEMLYSGPVKTTKTGLRTLKVRAEDKLGNEKSSKLIEIVIQ